MERLYQGLEKEISERAIGLTDKEKFVIKSMGLLILKPVCYAFNVYEIDYVLDREKNINKIQKLPQKVKNCPHQTRARKSLSFFQL